LAFRPSFWPAPRCYRGYIGAYHFEIAYPDLARLAAAVRRLAAYDYPIHSKQNARGTLSVYLKDPEGNEMELCHDQLSAEWLSAPVVQAVRVGPLGDDQGAE
jgi:catechol 2,3-dioxygenase